MERQILVVVAWADIIAASILRALPWVIALVVCLLATILRGDDR